MCTTVYYCSKISSNLIVLVIQRDKNNWICIEQKKCNFRSFHFYAKFSQKSEILFKIRHFRLKRRKIRGEMVHVGQNMVNYIGPYTFSYVIRPYNFNFQHRKSSFLAKILFLQKIDNVGHFQKRNVDFGHLLVRLTRSRLTSVTSSDL